MPFAEVKLVPGINVERTPTLLEAGYSASQLIRFKDSLVQKYGGWELFYSGNVSGVPRELHAWDDLNADHHLLVGTTTALAVITGSDLSIVTPQTLLSDFAPDFTTTIGSTTVEVTDPNIADLTTYDAVFFATPISVDGIILSGLYPINTITGTTSYTIVAATAGAAGVTSGGAVPQFTTTDTSSIVNVMLADHGLAVGDTIVFQIPTTLNGVTIDGAYSATAVTDADNFQISVSSVASASGSGDMNGGDAEVVYYIALGPPPAGAGFGLGGFGSGGFGTGVLTPNQIGTAITAVDWTLDNWGEIALACPQGGGIYYFDPTGGFTTARLAAAAPLFNEGAFVSTQQQILVAFGSSITQNIGVQQDPLLVQWSDVGNFLDWTPTATNQAGNFRIPLGSRIVGGMPVISQNLIWTDLDCWAMNYIGYPNVYGFNKIGAGAGLASIHAAQQLRGGVYWMGVSNFYVYNSGGVTVLPCPVWDAVFQNLNTDYIQNVRAMPNTPFNEVGWLYPSLASVNGECDSYVKMNITEPGAPWDYGTLSRSAWIDLSVFGHPLAATPGGAIYTHESGNDNGSSPMTSSFTTGYFYLVEGEEFCFVDQVYPDFKFGQYGASQDAQIQMYFNVINYPGDTPTVYGPYTVTQATQYISVRFRARQLSITIQTSDLGSFFRLGKIRFRYAPSGRR